MAELRVGGKCKHSDYHLRMLRGTYRTKAEGKVYEVVWLNETSIGVKDLADPHRKYPTQFNIRYMIPLEDELVVDMVCRYCQQSITADSPGAKPDIDPVTKEQSGYFHEACNPDFAADVEQAAAV